MSDTSLSHRDPFKNFFAWPRFIEDFELNQSRGLKIRETESSIIVEAVVAGVPTENVDVHIEDGVLTIKAEKTSEHDEKGLHSTNSYSYYYNTALSGGQWDKTDAEVENGVVIVTIPKAEAAKPHKVSVKVKK